MRLQTARLLAVTLAVAVLGQLPQAHAAHAPTAPPTLEGRLERLAAELEEKRQQLHIPGMAVAVVKDDEVVLARGFGVANVESQTPVTPQTLFPIGSSTKAFTATLIGMLVDEGKMGWDDPVTKHLPYFELKVDSDDPEAQVTLRDMLCHRTGFSRMSPLDAARIGREEILRLATRAEPFARFRQQWIYNNVMYLAAGMAAAAAAGSDWDALLAERILQPLGMTHSTTSVDDLPPEAVMAIGYAWEEGRERYRPQELMSVDGIAPAGAINSSALDMAQWVRFQLGRGELDGRRLISEAQLTETWKPQIEIGAGVSYGFGWLVTEWQGQPLLSHGGNTPGFTAQVALLPESGIGFVLLSNAFASQLQQVSVGLVRDALLGEPPAEGAPAGEPAYQDYLGTYRATHRPEELTIVEQNGRLALRMPGRGPFELKPPDEQGRWFFAVTDQAAVSFQRDAAGKVIVMTIHQGGVDVECVRAGVVLPPEVDLEELQPYLGSYRSEKHEADVEVIVQNNRLAVTLPQGITAELRPPDAEGFWAFRMKAGTGVEFARPDDGPVTAMTIYEDGEVAEELPRLAEEPGEPLPTADQILALRRSDDRKEALAGLGMLRFTGTVRMVHSGVEGKVTWYAAGSDRQREEQDLGEVGHISAIVNGDRAWAKSHVSSYADVRSTFVEQAKQGHPAAIFGDWRDFYDSIKVLRQADLDGRKAYVLLLSPADAPAHTVWVDAETGDALQDERLVVLPGGSSALPVTVRYEDYREMHNLRIPFRIITTNDVSGRVIVEFDRLEVGLEVGEDTFAIPADAE